VTNFLERKAVAAAELLQQKEPKATTAELVRLNGRPLQLDSRSSAKGNKAGVLDWLSKMPHWQIGYHLNSEAAETDRRAPDGSKS